jgi:quinol monooxygenase YgiN
MYVMKATIPVDPDSREDAIEAAAELARKSREEDGVVDYRIAADIEDENVLRFFEQYEDEDAVESHMESDHFLAFQGQIGDFVAGEVELVQFEVSDSQDLM